MRTIKIAGAGLSGLTAAINLAKAGFIVKVYEAKDSVGKRFAGDLQGLENWTDEEDILELLQKYNIKINFEYSPANNRIEIWTKDEKFHFGKKDFLKPVYYTVRRGEAKNTLDYSLLKQALTNKNITIKFNTPITDLKEVDIVATGPYTKDDKSDALAAGYTFEANIPDQSLIVLDDDIAPDGYGYFLSMNGHCALAVCIARDFPNGPNYRDTLYKLILDNKKFKNIRNIELFSGIGNYFIMESRPSKIYCGEAGGFQDLAMGFGMKYAIQTGYYAAQSIIQNISYYDLIDKYIKPRQEASIASRFIYQLFTGSSYTYLVKFMKDVMGTDKGLTFAYENNLLHKIFLPIAKRYYKKNIHNPRDFAAE